MTELTVITPTGPARPAPLVEPPSVPASGTIPPLMLPFTYRDRVPDDADAEPRMHTLSVISGTAILVEHPDRAGAFYLDALIVTDPESGERFGIGGDVCDRIKLALLQSHRDFESAWRAHVAEHVDALPEPANDDEALP